MAVSEDSCVGGRRVSLDLVCAGASTTCDEKVTTLPRASIHTMKRTGSSHMNTHTHKQTHRSYLKRKPQFTESVTGGVAGGGASETACDGVDDLAVHLSPGPVLSDLSASVCPLPLRVSPETRPWEPQTPNPVLRRSPNHWTGSEKRRETYCHYYNSRVLTSGEGR